MKKLPIAVVVLLAVVALAVPAQAQTCLKWVSFCDGIQIDSAFDQKINAQWYNYDCANTTVMKGKSKDNSYSSACGGTEDFLIRCSGRDGCEVEGLTGTPWHFVGDLPLDGSLDMVQGSNPGGTCWIDEIAYTVSLGACTGLAPEKGARSQQQQRSSIE